MPARRDQRRRGRRFLVPRLRGVGRLPEDYARWIRSLVDDYARIVRKRVLPRYTQTLPKENAPGARPAEALTNTLGGLVSAWQRMHPEKQLTAKALELATQASAMVKRSTDRIFQAAAGKDVLLLEQRQQAETEEEEGASARADIIGVDPFLGFPTLAVLLQRFAVDNVALITSVITDMHAELEAVVWQAWNAGETAAVATRLIEDRFGVGRSRATLIARDQMNKLNGALTMQRQVNVGVTHYIWRTVGDERVRASHAEKEGIRFAWTDPPPDTGHPGWDFNCRCVAEPDLIQFTGEGPEDVSETSTQEAMATAQERAREQPRRPVGFKAPGAARGA